MIDRRQHKRRWEDEGPKPAPHRVTVAFVCQCTPNLAETFFLLRLRQLVQSLDGDITTMAMHVEPVERKRD